MWYRFSAMLSVYTDSIFEPRECEAHDSKHIKECLENCVSSRQTTTTEAGSKTKEREVFKVFNVVCQFWDNNFKPFELNILINSYRIEDRRNGNVRQVFHIFSYLFLSFPIYSHLSVSFCIFSHLILS